MPKRIAYCSDGTWQVPLSGTNVYKLYKAILQTSDQVAYYDDHVCPPMVWRRKQRQSAAERALASAADGAVTK